MTDRNTENANQILMIAGEVSGDLHASGLLREFLKIQPGFHCFGVGGNRMKAEGFDPLFHVEDVAFLGLSEVVTHLPLIRRMMKTLLRECHRRKPRAVVLIDYPGFNLRFADQLRREPLLRDIPILYYISPQVWAWRASRVPKIARLVDRMAVIFDFEVPIYQKAGLKTDFVGHPLLEVTQPTSSKDDFRRRLGVGADDLLLALLPGSRMQEVNRLFPLFLNTYREISRNFPDIKAAVGCSPSLKKSYYENLLSKCDINSAWPFLLSGETYDLLAHSDVALVASGTATLETAILGTPMVMAYKVAPLTYWVGRHLVKIPNIALVNVVAGNKVVPEFIQQDATPGRIAAELGNILTDDNRRQRMISDLTKVRQKLGRPEASRNVAAILNEMISNRVARAE